MSRRSVVRSTHSPTRISVFITTNQFREQEPQHSASATIPLPRATADTLELLEAASEALRRVYRPGFAYHKVGVILGEFVGERCARGCSARSVDAGSATP